MLRALEDCTNIGCNGAIDSSYLIVFSTDE